MREWEFRIFVSGVPEELLAWSEAIYAQCDDAFCYDMAGETYADFERDAETLDAAIGSAVRQIKSCGYTVHRVEVPTEEIDRWIA